jgi:hypothetical protein
MSAPWTIEAVISRDSLKDEPRPFFKPGDVHRVDLHGLKPHDVEVVRYGKI